MCSSITIAPSYDILHARKKHRSCEVDGMRRRSRQQGSAVAPANQNSEIITRYSTLLSSSIDVNIVEATDDAPRDRPSFLSLRSIRSLPTRFRNAYRQHIMGKNKSSKSMRNLSTATASPASSPHFDPIRELEAVNSTLNEMLGTTRTEILSARRKGKLDLDLHHHLKFEVLLNNTISAVDSCRVYSEEMAFKYAHQLSITAGLELSLSSKQLEIDQMRNLSANTAHDLKSPLHVMTIGIEYLRGSDTTYTNHQETIDCLDSACAFMQSSITRTMDFALISGGMELTPSNSSFHLHTVLQGPCKWIRMMIPDDSRMLIELLPIDGISVTVVSDQHWVEENLLCLLSNAVKYSNHGTITVRVILNGANIRIMVEDMGIGIAAESKHLLFRKFSKLQKMASGSTGLGLYSLSKRCEAMQGSCGVCDRSDGNQGSVFWFEFPCVVSEECAAMSAHGSASSEREDSSLTILIVDDSLVVIKFLTKCLHALGHNTVTAYNGAEGLQKVIEAKNVFDLVIMDLQMPVMDGIEATKRIRTAESSDPSRTKLPIICSSANSNNETETLAFAAGVDYFLPKPFNKKALYHLISGLQVKMKEQSSSPP